MIRLALVAAVLAAACHRHPPDAGRRFHPLPALGARLLVVAPHPDDEALGAGGMIADAVRRGTTVEVVVASDGEAGRDKSRRARDLGAVRVTESRRALATLGLGAGAVRFLHYADGHLAAAWGEHWVAARSDGSAVSAAAVVDDLRAALRGLAPTALVLPMPLDQHADHHALDRFTLLAVLGELDAAPEPELLGYLIHGGRDWPVVPPRDACLRTVFPWTRMLLGPPAVAEKAALLHRYATQVGRGGRLMLFAGRNELFARGEVLHANRPMSAVRPGVHRAPGGVVIRVPRSPCALDLAAGDRLRLRFFRAGAIEERVVRLHTSPDVVGGPAGRSLRPMRDIEVDTHPSAVRLALSPALDGVRGAVVEVVPGRRNRVGPAWLVVWG